MDVEAVAAQAFAVLGTGRQVASFSAGRPEFALSDAYRVTARLRALREARGEKVVGRKIGFTNRTIWDEYNVHAPIWGYVYDVTQRDIPESGGEADIAGLAEPRIEPEIVFGLARAPEPGMDAGALAGCLDWVAHGFEIVQSIFPGWVFSPADTIAAYGLHGGLWIGPRHRVGERRADWTGMLESFEIDLFRDGRKEDHGRARNVLDGPLHALAHLVVLLADDPVNPPLVAGEIVTTGSLTRAFPVAKGETWSTALSGVPLDGARIAIV